MNFEELVHLKEKAESGGMRLPLGFFLKQQSNGKYVNRVEIRGDFADNAILRKAIQLESEENAKISDKSQLHFCMSSSSLDNLSFDVESGSYKSFTKLLSETPAIVADKGFIDSVIDDLFRLTSLLHSRGIYHCCYSPDNVFVRAGDNRFMLLFHGSFYKDVIPAQSLYEGFEDYVAPEVLNGECIDERSDVYSIGKFFQYVFSIADIPYEYKKVIRKASNTMPDKRYSTVTAMLTSFRRRSSIRRSFSTLMVAVVISLIIVGGYFNMIPETSSIEYVKPEVRRSVDDLLDDGFDPETELGVLSSDTAIALTEEERMKMKEYEDKCEQIFRRQFTKEAERILSKVYNNSYMGNSEKQFVAGCKNTMSELVEIQNELAKLSNLGSIKSQRIASEIIDKITEEKKKSLGSRGIQK